MVYYCIQYISGHYGQMGNAQKPTNCIVTDRKESYQCLSCSRFPDCSISIVTNSRCPLFIPYYFLMFNNWESLIIPKKYYCDLISVIFTNEWRHFELFGISPRKWTRKISPLHRYQPTNLGHILLARFPVSVYQFLSWNTPIFNFVPFSLC